MKITPQRLIIIGIVVVLTIGLSFMAKKWGSEKPEPPREYTLKRGDLEISILATGDVKPENRLAIKPPLAGRIDSVLAQEGQEVKAGQILALMSSNERAALLDAARAKGSEEVAYWENLYRPIPIIAPLAGTIIHRNVEAGQTFDTGAEIFAMSDRLLIKAQVDETDLSRIQLKQRTRVNLDAYPKHPMMGTVHKISYESKIINNVTTYVIDVVTDEVPTFMRSGMTANISFILDSKNDVLLVPMEALVERDGTRYAVIKIDKKSPVEKPVEIGISDGKMAEVVSGLEEGQVVIAPRLSATKGQEQNSPFGFGPPRSNRRR